MFTTEEDRLAHPQASLIPKKVWKDYFFGLHDATLSAFFSIMQASDESLDNDFDNFLSQHPDFAPHAWLALAYAHPRLSDNVLLDYLSRASNTHSLHLPLHLVVLHGRLNLLKTFINRNVSNTSYQTLLAKEEYVAFRWGAVHGNRDIVNFFYATQYKLDPSKCQTMLEANQYAALRFAAKYGHLDIVKYLFEQQQQLDPSKCQAMLEADRYGALCFAAENGHLDVVQYLFEQQQQLDPSKCQAMLNRAFCLASATGHVNVMQYLFEQQARLDSSKCQAMLEGDQYLGFILAAQNGHLGAIQYLFAKQQRLDPSKCQSMLEAQAFRGFILAVECGHIDVARYLMFQQALRDHTKIPEMMRAVRNNPALRDLARDLQPPIRENRTTETKLAESRTAYRKRDSIIGAHDSCDQASEQQHNANP